MKKYMIAYISPTYGLLMAQIELDNYPAWHDVERVLIQNGESRPDIVEIRQNGNWEVKEIK